ncbi:MAG: hypothetical protein HRU09_06680 [Oligoflexales bacterium]|nr:hypothetical protein [Oligoflexales bacterium]
MGLIDKYREFKKNRQEKAIARNLKLIKNPKAIKEDRSAAIEYFCQAEEAEVAVPALLQRFDYSLEHGINDTREKESAMEGVIKFDKSAIPFIEKHLHTSNRIAWPIKAFKKIASEEEIMKSLESCLDYGEVSFDQSKVDKNYDILCYMRDYPLADAVCEKLFHFLNEHDERVRFAAAEVLLEQKESSIPEKLEPFLLDESAENTRIRQTVIAGFAKNQWAVPHKDKFKVGPFIPGVSINNQYNFVIHE